MEINSEPIDGPSQRGQFGWEKIGGDELAIPVIVRRNGLRYCPVRIVEQEIIKRYDAIPKEVFQCISMKSYYITFPEAKLLTLINTYHCNARYGESMFNVKDVIISVPDIIELSRFLNRTCEIFTKDLTRVSPMIGIVRVSIGLNCSNYFLVPYIGKVIGDSNNQILKFVPWKLVAPFTMTTEKSKRAYSNEWDIMYLKMLSIYCKNPNVPFQAREDELILLESLLYTNTDVPIAFQEITSV